MKRPAFQFYPADWVSNKNLRRCSFHLRGVWIAFMCLAHDSDEYGIIRWELKEIAMAIGCDTDDLRMLAQYGILKGSDKDTISKSFAVEISQKNAPSVTVELIPAQPGPIWFSSRMVRDEHIRESRAKHGSKSIYNPNVPRKKEGISEAGNQATKKDMVSLSQKDKVSISPSPSSSSTSSFKKDKRINVEFPEKPETSTPPTLVEIYHVPESGEMVCDETHQQPDPEILGKATISENKSVSTITPTTPTNSREKVNKRDFTQSASMELVRLIVDDLNQVTGSRYKPSNKNTVSAILARIADGFTLEDFKTVHRKKAKQWLNDPKMGAYLRPETLYRPGKFEGYLNEPGFVKLEPSKDQELEKVSVPPASGKEEVMWEKVLGELSKLILPENFEKWIKPCRFGYVNSSTAILITPGRNHKEVIEDNYQLTIKDFIERDLMIVAEEQVYGKNSYEGKKNLLNVVTNKRQGGLSVAYPQ